jgi:phosphoglycolate phosphatase-like HAD superfamily hydrolase
MAPPPPLQAIIFDFDGVIVESLEVKTDAFRQLFSGHPEHVDEVVRLHVENQGLSRYEKFRIIYRDLLRRPLGADELARLDREFSALVYERVVACDFVAGAPEFLARASRELRCFVASATPQEELVRIVGARGLASRFTGVFGSPRGKSEIIAGVLDDGVAAGAALCVGDALSDYRAASANDVAFIGRVPDGEPDAFAGLGVPAVRDLAELGDRWGELISARDGALTGAPDVPGRRA